MVRVLGRLVIQVLRFVLLCRLFAGADTSYCFDILNRVQDDGDTGRSVGLIDRWCVSVRLVLLIV
jgi:hypothetical protein